MRKIILAITLTTSIVALFFTMQAFADNIQTAAVSTSQSPYPPPEILLTNTHISTDFLASTPYPEPLDLLIVPTVLSNPSFDVTDSSYFTFIPIILKPPYNRASAIVYADTWAHNRNSNYPNYGIGCDDCNDCTNYVSQILFTGGLPLRTGNWDPNSVFEWWYRKVLFWFENSLTWSATPEFNIYLFQYPSDFELRSWPTELEGGDFFVMDLRGRNSTRPAKWDPGPCAFCCGIRMDKYR